MWEYYEAALASAGKAPAEAFSSILRCQKIGIHKSHWVQFNVFRRVFILISFLIEYPGFQAEKPLVTGVFYRIPLIIRR